MFPQFMEDKLKYANEKLLIKDNSQEERYNNLIFLYCPPKVGSTSLVTSLRIFACEKFHIMHLHNDKMLKQLYDVDVTINDIIKYNSSLGKNIYVIDIYRLPIEHKISIFFEKLEKYHFNNSVENIEKYPIEKLIRRFNMLFPHLGNNDYFRKEYSITYPKNFDFEKKYSIVKNGNIRYIKLRLIDSSTQWSNSLKEILDTDVKIMRDYETSEKSIGIVFKKFVENYKIPKNLLQSVKEDSSFYYYNTKEDVERYLNNWGEKTSTSIVPYTKEEYILYDAISLENKYMNEVQNDHYLDCGCLCETCREKRKKLRDKLFNGEHVDMRIKHERVRERRVFRQVVVKKKQSGIIGLNMLKGSG